MSDAPQPDRKTVAIPNQIRDALIVPNTRVPLPTSENRFTVLQQSWIFAQQWKRSGTADRNVVELAVGAAAADYLAAIDKASQTARGKEVILAVGQGGAGGFRGLTQTVFDAIPSAARRKGSRSTRSPSRARCSSCPRSRRRSTDDGRRGPSEIPGPA